MASMCASRATYAEVQEHEGGAEGVHAHARHRVEGAGCAAVSPAAAGRIAIFEVLPACCASCSRAPAANLAAGPALLQHTFCRTRGVLRNLSRHREQHQLAEVRPPARHASRAGRHLADVSRRRCGDVVLSMTNRS